jgi:hypothetical protein
VWPNLTSCILNEERCGICNLATYHPSSMDDHSFPGRFGPFLTLLGCWIPDDDLLLKDERGLRRFRVAPRPVETIEWRRVVSRFPSILELDPLRLEEGARWGQDNFVANLSLRPLLPNVRRFFFSPTRSLYEFFSFSFSSAAFSPQTSCC